MAHSYGDMHATSDQSDLGGEDKARLHEAVGHVADMESARQQGDLARLRQADESDPQKQQELQDHIDALQSDYDASKAQAQEKVGYVMTQVTQVGDSISNLISEANSMINNSVWHQEH